MKPTGPVLRRSEYVVEPVPRAMARQLFRAYHYTSGSSSFATYRHGLFSRDNPMDCLGAAFWMPAPLRVGPTIGVQDHEALTLSRLVVEPGMPTNAASFLIAGSIRLIRTVGRYRALITYADEAQGHTGGIYRATNWEYIGTTPGTAAWVNDRGHQVHARGRDRMRTVEEMKALGYRQAPGSVKHKFVMRLA